MICLVYDKFGVSTFTIIIYTCIWIPFLQIKRALLTIVLSFSYDHHDHSGGELYPHQEEEEEEEEACLVDLSVVRFEEMHEVRRHGNGWNNSSVDDQLCSVCLVEFEQEDVVSRLNRCGHVFHSGCIEGWIDRNQFTCPLCRSLFLHVPGKSREKC